MKKKQKKRSRFKYQRRGRDSVRKRANQVGGQFDPIFKDKFPVLRIKEGGYRIRIMPPTWDDADHYGMDIYVHYGIGADQGSYLCLEKMLKKECPVCAERRALEKAGDVDAAKALSPTKRVVVWAIDRKDEDAGPQLWAMPWTVDRDFATLSEDRDSGEVLAVDDPEEGYDLSFSREGSGLKTKYVGARIARKPSPLSDEDETMDEWLAFIEKNPLPSVMRYFDAEHIAGIFAGGSKDDDDEDDEDDEDEKPRSRRGKKRDDDDDDDDDVDDGDEDDELDDYTDGDDDDDDSDDDDDFDEADDDDDEDDEDERPPTGRKRGRTRSRSDEDEDDDDDDGPARRALKNKKKNKKRK